MQVPPSDRSTAGDVVQLNPRPVTSFAECVAAGNSVMETYPEQCYDPISGRGFTMANARVPALRSTQRTAAAAARLRLAIETGGGGMGERERAFELRWDIAALDDDAGDRTDRDRGSPARQIPRVVWQTFSTATFANAARCVGEPLIPPPTHPFGVLCGVASLPPPPFSFPSPVHRSYITLHPSRR